MHKIDKIYFLGIGGIGMSALARYFLFQGAEIYGYDLTPSPLTTALEDEGMHIHYQVNISDIPSGLDFVIYTPAIPNDHEELLHFQKSNIPIYKRSEIVGIISKDHFTIAIAGTHGKTSISALTAHMLNTAGKKIIALVGGIMRHYNSNMIASENADYYIIEADEYDRSFMQLKPDVAIISSVDADHLDIYGSSEQMQEGFNLFAQNLKKDGSLIINEKVKGIEESTQTYGFQPGVDIRASNIHIADGKFVFDLEYGSTLINNIKMTIPGHHYIENAMAAAAIGFYTKLSNDQIKSGLESFEGVERRFEVRVENNQYVYIDDYAHHPAEILATIKAVRLLHPDRKITGVFQPHLFSRTKDFAMEFASALEDLDEIILLPIYPAREKQIEGVTSQIIYDKIKNKNKEIIQKQDLVSYLENQKNDVMITMGAGDIGLLAPEIEKMLTQ